MDFNEQRQVLQDRRKRFAEQSKYQNPEGQMVGGHFVAPNPLEYLAAGLRSVGGMTGEKYASDEIQALGQKERDMMGGETKALAQALRGTPQKTEPFQAPAFDEQDAAMMGQQGMQNVTQEAAPGSYDAFMDRALQSPVPQIQQMWMQGLMKMPELEAKKQERLADREFKAQQAQQAHALRMDALRESNATRQQMADEQRAHQENMIRLTKSLTPGPAAAQPYFQFMQTGEGILAGNARTGQLQPVMVDGKPVVGSTSDPALQGQIAGAKKTATAEAENIIGAKTEARKADMFIQQLNQADALLNEGPTESGAGAAVDALGRIVGYSPESAQKAGQLEALSGWLVANVPRMEGPQSNFDVQNYMTMAGKIGDRTVPVKERQAALTVVKELQEKYKVSAQQRAGGQNPSAPTAPPQGAKRLVFNPQTGRLE